MPLSRCQYITRNKNGKSVLAHRQAKNLREQKCDAVPLQRAHGSDAKARRKMTIESRKDGIFFACRFCVLVAGVRGSTEQ
jgi:hypothetical protein